jgi:ribosomal protein S15P/S13E
MTEPEDELQGYPDWKKKLIRSKYGKNTFGASAVSPYDLADIDERLKDLESHVFRTARKETTKRGIQMLLMKELGFLDLLTINPLTFINGIYKTATIPNL